MRIMRFRPSLRQLLSVIFFLFATISAVAIGVLWTNSAWNREVQKVHDQHVQLASHLAEALSRYAEDVEAVFNLAVSSLDKSQPILHLDTLLRRLHFKHVCIVNEYGEVKQLIAPDADLQIERIPDALLAKLRTENDTRATPMSNVLPALAGDPTLFLWYAISPGQYALGALDTAYFSQLQKAISFGEKGHAAIVDRSGHIIAHPLQAWQDSMKDISHLDPIRRMMAGETGVSWFYSPAVKADMVAGFTTVPKTGWDVMVPQPVSELQAHVNKVKRAVWSMVGAILLASAVIGWLVSKWLASPLHRIGETAERFAKGGYDARAGEQGALQTREAATLATQFDTMADEVVSSGQAQREIEERFREFAEIAADWFWETDMNQVFTYMSPMTHTGRRWDADYFIGRHRREFIYDNPDDQLIGLIQDYMDREAPFDQVTYTARGRDDEPIHVVMSGRPMRNADGVVIGYRGVVRDVTEHMRIETIRREAKERDETRQAQKMEALGTLAGGIAHDFNNTLGIILGYTDLSLKTIPEPDPLRQHLQYVFDASQRAKKIVEQILTFSRKGDPERKAVYLHEVVREALKLVRASLPATIDIYQEIPDDIKDVVLADMTQIHQVIMNLCANAGHAMRDAGGILEVRIDIIDIDDAFILATDSCAELRPGSHVRLSIRDTGRGMEPDIVERIFDPYFTTKEMGEGTGMGLAVVHGITASHGGAITVKSRLDEGTTFDIYLPQIDIEIERDFTEDDELPHGKESILFVDDEEILTLLMQEMLTQLGYDVEVRTSSLEALATFRAAPDQFDLVITDLTMPIMPGDVLAQELRAIRPDIPLILCTGHSHGIDADRAALLGFDAFCMKPLVMHDFGLVIRRVLSRHTANSRAR